MKKHLPSLQTPPFPPPLTQPLSSPASVPRDARLVASTSACRSRAAQDFGPRSRRFPRPLMDRRGWPATKEPVTRSIRPARCPRVPGRRDRRPDREDLANCEPHPAIRRREHRTVVAAQGRQLGQASAGRPNTRPPRDHPAPAASPGSVQRPRASTDPRGRIGSLAVVCVSLSPSPPT